MFHDIDILVKILAKADARVSDDLVLAHAGLVSNDGRTDEKALHILDDVTVFRTVLVMHDDDRDTIFRGYCCHLPRFRPILEAPDVIHDMSARTHGIIRCFRLICIDGDRNGAGFDEARQNRFQSGNLFSCRNRRKARPRRFSTDIDDIRPFSYHLFHMLQSDIGVIPLPAVRKRIRRIIEDPHDQRPFPDSQRFSIFPIIMTNFHDTTSQQKKR